MKNENKKPDVKKTKTKKGLKPFSIKDRRTKIDFNYEDNDKENSEN